MKKIRKNVIKKASVILASSMFIGGAVLPAMMNTAVPVEAAVTEYKKNTVYKASVNVSDEEFEFYGHVNSKCRLLAGSNGEASLELELLDSLMGNVTVKTVKIHSRVNDENSALSNLDIAPAKGKANYRNITGKVGFGPIRFGEKGKYYGAYELSNGKTGKFSLTIDWNTLEETAEALPEGHEDVKKVATPVIRPESGNISKATPLSITCDTDGASIYYTTDGSDPETSSAKELYDPAFPIMIDKSMKVRAKARVMADGWSNEAHAVYTFSASQPDDKGKETNVFTGAEYKEGEKYDTLTLFTNSSEFNEGTRDVPEKGKPILKVTEYYMDLTQPGKDKVHCVYNGGIGGFIAPFDSSKAKNKGSVIINIPKGHFDRSKPVDLNIVNAGYNNTHVLLDLKDTSNITMKQESLAPEQIKTKKHVKLKDLEKGKTYTGSFQAKRIDDPSRDSMLAGFFDKNVKLEIDNEGNVKASFYNTVFAFSMIDFAAQFPDGSWGAAQSDKGSRVPVLSKSSDTIAAIYTFPIPDPKKGSFVGAVNVKAMGGSEGMFGHYDRYTKVNMIFNDDFTEGFEGFTSQTLALTQEQIVNRALMTIDGIDKDGDGVVSDEELASYDFSNAYLDFGRGAMFKKYNIGDNFNMEDISWLKKIGKKDQIKSLGFNDMRIMKIKDELKGFTNLERLDLSANVIDEIEDDAFSDNTKLTNINLKSNMLTKIKARTFSGLKNLESELDLENNQLSEIEPGAFDELQKVNSFGFGNNKFEKFDLEKIFTKNPGRIQTLVLNGNKLSDMPQNLKKASDLSFLALSDNEITSIGEELDGFKNLSVLYLNNNLLTEVPESLVASNPKLRTLKLEKNSISKLPKSMLDKLAEDEFTSVYEFNAIDADKLDLNGYTEKQKEAIKSGINKYPSKNEYSASLTAKNGIVDFKTDISALDYYIWTKSKDYIKNTEADAAIAKILGKEKIENKEDLRKFRKENLPDMSPELINKSILTYASGTVDTLTFTNEIQKLVNGRWETMWQESKTQKELAKTGTYTDQLAKDGDKYRLLVKVQSSLKCSYQHTYVINAKNTGDAGAVDKNNLREGKYTIGINMVKPDRVSKSMSDDAITHTAVIEVRNGKPYIRVKFHGMTVDDKFGYLGKLSYYDEGYSYNYMGVPKGEIKDAKVISTQKDKAGNDVIDEHNSLNSLYPNEVEIPVVPSVLKDKDGYLPLHVFVPIMESLSKGNGDQDVLMKLDWNSLKKSDGNISVPDETEKKDDKKPEITNKGVKIKTPAGERVLAEGYYAVSGEMFKAVDRNQHSMANDAINHKVIIKVKDGKVDLLMDFNGLDINGKMGYLGKLSYYDEGYTYSNGNDGYIRGVLKEAEVLSRQQGEESAPNVVRFPYVKTAREDASGYIPLHVFVPVMESISRGTGDQDVYLKLNLETTKKITDKEVDDFINSDPSKTNKPSDHGNTGLHSTISRLNNGNWLSTGGLRSGSNPGMPLLSGRPGTGDVSNTVTWIAVSVVAGAVAGTAYFTRNKKEDREA